MAKNRRPKRSASQTILLVFSLLLVASMIISLIAVVFEQTSPQPAPTASETSLPLFPTRAATVTPTEPAAGPAAPADTPAPTPTPAAAKPRLLVALATAHGSAGLLSQVDQWGMD